MNQKIKNGLLLIIITGIASTFCTGITYAPYEFYTISTIKIDYEFHDWGKTYEKHYTIELLDDTYYCEGRKIDTALIHALPDTFTDFYEVEEKPLIFDIIIDFTVEITLDNKKTIVLTAVEWKNCFVPWVIEYKGKTYLQYNGQIPSALLKILVHLDREWSTYTKEIEWGCYPVPVPAQYSTVSRDFPQSRPVYTGLETKGRTHLLWETAVAGVIGPPVYADGYMYVLTREGVLAFDAVTGETLWATGVTGEDTMGDIVAHNNTVYAGVPPFMVYCLDGKTGSIYWKSILDTREHVLLQITPVADNLLVYEPWGEGLFCLDRKTGKILWVIRDIIENVNISGDKIFLEAHNEPYQRYYYAVVDGSGNTIWEEHQGNLLTPAYCHGIVYYSEKGTFVAQDIYTQEEIWSYRYGEQTEELHAYDFLMGQAVSEKNIFLLVPDWREYFHVWMVLLDTKGTLLWKTLYPADGTVKNTMPRIKVMQNVIYFLVEGGFIEAFGLENGRELWRAQVKGPEICTIQAYDNKVYISDVDSLYCLDSETGNILWIFNAGKQGELLTPVTVMYVSEIGDGLLCVATKERIFVVSL